MRCGTIIVAREVEEVSPGQIGVVMTFDVTTERPGLVCWLKVWGHNRNDNAWLVTGRDKLAVLRITDVFDVVED